MADSSDHFPASARAFATTHWSLVLAAGQEDSTLAKEPLEKLCRAYWYPVYAFIRRWGRSPEDAEDLTQAFWALFLEKHYLDDVDRSKGRFRSFLLASVRHFLSNEWDKQRRLKRGGAIQMVLLEGAAAERRYQFEPSHDITPERLFERSWAMALIDQVHQELEAEQIAGGKAALFSALQIYLTGDKERPPYAATASQLGMSVEAVRKAVERLRQRYGLLLRQVVAQTVDTPEEIDAELRHLRVVLSG